jgi:ParB family transcriptional regulator, chromosome partitioning protein
MEKRPALGKGLSALIPDSPGPALAAQPAGVFELDIDHLAPNDYQPRHQMDDARLDELTASIKANGIIQPIVVRKIGDAYRIIAGERRWRAAQRAGLTRVPVVVKDVAADEAGQRKVLEIALIENIQREDLNPIDEAKAYRRLVDEFSLTQDAVASAVGKDRATVANTLRLLKLPGEVQNDVAAGAITMGHARALLALPGDNSQLELAREIKTRALSVRETEALVRRVLEGDHVSPPATPRPPAAPADVHTRAAEDKLKLLLGTRVRIKRKAKGGRIEIDFTSENELIRIYEALTEK